MTKINEFYLSKNGKACHINFDSTPKFLSLGLNILFDGVDFLIDKTKKTSSFIYSFKLKQQEENKLFNDLEKLYQNKLNGKLNNSINTKAESIDINTNIDIEQLNKDTLNLFNITFPKAMKDKDYPTLSSDVLLDKLDDTLSGLKKSPIFVHKYKIIGLTATAALLISALSYQYHLKLNDLLKELPNSKQTEEIIDQIKPSNPKFLTSLFSSKLEAFQHLLTSTEGESPMFNEDNDGIAVGYGWNPTKNSKEFNLKIAKAIGMNAKEQIALENISINSDKEKNKKNKKSRLSKTQHVPDSLKNVVLSKTQLDTSATVMMNAYEKEFLNVVKVKSAEKNEDFSTLKNNYFSLPYNQQAVLLHMTYKVGATRLLKYNDLFDDLFNYMKNPTIDNLQKASTVFEYSYITRAGNKKHDVRVEKEHQSFFIDYLNDKDKVLNKIKNNASQVKNTENVTENKINKKTAG